jgi:hypothetical protein
MQFVCKFFTFLCRKNIGNNVLDDKPQIVLCPLVFVDTFEKRASLRKKQVVMTIDYNEMWTKTLLTGTATSTLQYGTDFHPSQDRARKNVTQNVASDTYPPNSVSWICAYGKPVRIIVTLMLTHKSFLALVLPTKSISRKVESRVPETHIYWIMKIHMEKSVVTSSTTSMYTGE